MRVGIDARMIYWNGIGRYIKGLLEQFSQKTNFGTFVLFAESTILTGLPTAPHFEKIPVNGNPFSLRGQLNLERVLQHVEIDLFHATHFIIPLFSKAAVIVTIHDLIPWFFPRVMPGWHRRFLYKVLNILAVRKASAILVPSESTKSQVIRYMGFPSNRIFVVPHAPPSQIYQIRDVALISKVKKHIGIHEPFILAIGNPKPHKNIGSVLRAYELLKKHFPEFRLVLIGRADNLQRWFHRMPSGVILTGKLTDTELAVLYTTAELFIFPSIHEGFGFPPLEAMVCKTPVVASNLSSMPEVLGDAAILVNPLDPKAIANAAIKVLRDENLRQNLVEKGLKRAKFYSWEQTALKTLKIYKQVSR